MDDRDWFDDEVVARVEALIKRGKRLGEQIASRFAPKRPAVTMSAHEEAETTLLSNLA